MSDIRVNDLAVLSPSALDDTYNTIVFTSDGDTNQVAFEDAVAQANANKKQGLLRYQEVIASADVLASNATPITISIPRESGESIFPIKIVYGMNAILTPYATNTVAAVRFVGADVPISTCDMLGRTVTGAELGSDYTTTAVGETQILATTDLEFYTQTGNPTAGDGTLTIDVFYYVQ
jgi:hypothetical protein